MNGVFNQTAMDLAGQPQEQLHLTELKRAVVAEQQSQEVQDQQRVVMMVVVVQQESSLF